MRWMILAGLALAGSVGAQTIYRCEVDGATQLQNWPCGEEKPDGRMVAADDPSLTSAGELERLVIERASSAMARAAAVEVNRLHLAMELFYLDNGKPPASLYQLTTTKMRGESEPYIWPPSALFDPWGNRYQFRSPGKHSHFDVYSYGPAGRDAAESELIGNW